MMNHPTEDRLKKIEERLDKIEQQQTEPIKVTIERRQTETERTLDNHTEILKDVSIEQDSQSELLQTIFTMAGTQNADIAVLKHEMQGARADIIAIKATQSDHGELLKEHGQRLGRIEENQSKHNKRFDTIERTMATKEDIVALKATQDEHSKRFDKIEATQDAQGQKLDLILQLLKPRGE